MSKVNQFIDSWVDYKVSRDLIRKFIRNHNAHIRNGNYDEKLTQFHKRALVRIKDMAKHSKIYASGHSGEETKGSYSSRMDYSLNGLINNEFGTSLYRIEKAIRFVQTNA